MNVLNSLITLGFVVLLGLGSAAFALLCLAAGIIAWPFKVAHSSLVRIVKLAVERMWGASVGVSNRVKAAWTAVTATAAPAGVTIERDNAVQCATDDSHYGEYTAPDLAATGEYQSQASCDCKPDESCPGCTVQLQA